MTATYRKGVAARNGNAQDGDQLASTITSKNNQSDANRQVSDADVTLQSIQYVDDYVVTLTFNVRSARCGTCGTVNHLDAVSRGRLPVKLTCTGCDVTLATVKAEVERR